MLIWSSKQFRGARYRIAPDDRASNLFLVGRQPRELSAVPRPECQWGSNERLAQANAPTSPGPVSAPASHAKSEADVQCGGDTPKAAHAVAEPVALPTGAAGVEG